MARKRDLNNYPLQTIIPRDAAEYLAKLAEEDDRSMVKYVKRIVMDHLKAKGYVENAKVEIKKDKEEHTDKEETQKKSSSVVDDEKVEQSANCNTLSSTNRSRKRNTKVAPIPINFVK